MNQPTIQITAETLATIARMGQRDVNEAIARIKAGSGNNDDKRLVASFASKVGTIYTITGKR